MVLQPSRIVSPDRIETARLVLRRPVFGDTDGLYAMLSDPQLFRYSHVPLIDNAMDVKHIIIDWDEHWDKGLRTYIIARKRAVDEPIGFVNIGRDEELGGVLMQSAAGVGLAEETIRALIPALQLTRAWTLIDAEIAPLIRLLEKVDFHVEQVLPRYRVHPQVSTEKRDCVLIRQNNRMEVSTWEGR